jgi:hypothetical protein
MADGTMVVRVVEFTKVVATGLVVTPLYTTASPAAKPDPVKVSICPVTPCGTTGGSIDANTGAGYVKASVSAGVDVPPPGSGLVTVTPTLPELAGRLFGMGSVRVVLVCVDGATVIASAGAVPVKVTVDDVVNPVPVIVSEVDEPSW